RSAHVNHVDERDIARLQLPCFFIKRIERTDERSTHHAHDHGKTHPGKGRSFQFHFSTVCLVLRDRPTEQSSSFSLLVQRPSKSKRFEIFSSVRRVTSSSWEERPARRVARSPCSCPGWRRRPRDRQALKQYIWCAGRRGHSSNRPA